jgi:hypothetical protein
MLGWMPELNDAQRAIWTGLFVKKSSETLAIVVVLWLIASVVVGTITIVSWIGSIV